MTGKFCLNSLVKERHQIVRSCGGIYFCETAGPLSVLLPLPPYAFGPCESCVFWCLASLRVLFSSSSFQSLKPYPSASSVSQQLMLMAVLNCLFDSLSQMLRWAVHSWHVFGRESNYSSGPGICGESAEAPESWFTFRSWLIISEQLTLMGKAGWMESTSLWNNSPKKKGIGREQNPPLCDCSVPQWLCQSSKHPPNVLLDSILYIRDQKGASTGKCPR